MGKEGGNIHKENFPSFPLNLLGKLRGNFHKDDLLKFPNKSVWKSWGRGLFANWGQRCHYLDSCLSLSLEFNLGCNWISLWNEISN